MKISFQKQEGDPSLGIAFFWRMKIEVDSPTSISDSFIPELFYDYFFVQKGEVRCVDSTSTQEAESSLPPQALKTIHTHRITFTLIAPLVLFGARLSLKFAELFWERNLPSNSFLETDWVGNQVNDLATFASQVSKTIQKNRQRKTAAPMLSPTLKETEWMAYFSPRHKRRLYKSVFGISKKEMRAIQNVHAFLGQTCDFTMQSPRIIEHINSKLFYDQPHLNHTFKKVTGLSPMEHFQANSILQDNLMAASYNAFSK